MEFPDRRAMQYRVKNFFLNPCAAKWTAALNPSRAAPKRMSAGGMAKGSSRNQAGTVSPGLC